jgi:hypothetical protein
MTPEWGIALLIGAAILYAAAYWHGHQDGRNWQLRQRGRRADDLEEDLF